MTAMLFCIIFLVLSAVLSAILREHRHKALIALTGIGAAAITGIGGVLLILLTSSHAFFALGNGILPYGNPSCRIDLFSGIFIILLLVLATLTAMTGGGLGHRDGRDGGVYWFFYNILIAGMLIVLLAADAMTFLLGWEIMTLASFFLVSREHCRAEVRKAGWVYLVASHLSFFPLLAFFCLLSAKAGGSLSFTDFAVVRLSGGEATALFLLALVGFGTKAGLPGLHVWQPTAYDAAPGATPALLSGIMSKMGVYGLLRCLSFCGEPSAWWGWVMIGLGCVAGLYGVMMALSQSNLKKVLAYSSLENMGIIFIGLGIGVTALAERSYLVAATALTGAMLHIVNHGLFKSLLFQTAGAVVTATGNRSIEALGGLQKRMPVTGVCTMAGSAAIAGLPPFNGFISEFLIYYAAFAGLVTVGGLRFTCLIGIAALALIGGLALACFVRFYGIIFCGMPRSEQAEKARDIPTLAQVPLVGGVVFCLLVTMMAPWIAQVCWAAIMTGMTIPGYTATAIEPLLAPLNGIAIVATVATSIGGLLVLLRQILLRHREVTRRVTWDCGYCRSNSRIQYTGGSLAQPITEFFRSLLKVSEKQTAPEGLFPRTASWKQSVGDFFLESFWTPLFQAIYRFSMMLHPFQDGRVQVYILYIVITVMALLLWTVL